MSQTIHQVVNKNNAGFVGELGPKCHKQSVGTITSEMDARVLLQTEESETQVHLGSEGLHSLSPSDEPRSIPSVIDESALVPPHHLEMNEDEENNEESCKLTFISLRILKYCILFRMSGLPLSAFVNTFDEISRLL